MKKSFFAFMYRMRYIKRWGLMKNSASENLAEHSLDVSIIAHALGVISRVIYKNDYIDENRCASLAIFHDAAEILTGDLPTPIKYYNTEILKAYKDVERSAVAKLLSTLPQDMRATYSDIFNVDTGYMHELVHWADRISAYIKCIDEVKSGNGEFKTALAQIEQQILKCQLPEVGYFVENFIPAYSYTLDELG